MFNLSLLIGDSGTVWTVAFKDRAKAEEAALAINSSEPLVSIADDFGAHIHVCRDAIRAVLLADVVKGSDAEIERALHQARTQAKANQKAQSDPALRFLQPTVPQGGPSFRV